MFQERIAKLTAEHLRTHAQAYLEELETEFTGSDKLRLKVPDISSVSLVGGVIQAPHDALPLIGVDCMDKTVIPSNESLYLYQYDGAIVGMVSTGDESSVDRAAKRFQRITERFVRDHLYLHENFDASPLDPNFRFREFLFTGSNFSGAMELELEEIGNVWVGGFTTNVFWITSEDGEVQHT